jgi:hypothetical protein
MRRIFGSIYWHPTLLRALVAIICLAGAVWLVMEYFNPAPPSTITIATGAKGGAYEFFAQQYREKLARSHVRLNIRITEGTSENIRLLEDPKSGVQVAFVVGGASNSQEAPGLLSLGRVNYQVFWLFYRGTYASILSCVTPCCKARYVRSVRFKESSAESRQKNLDGPQCECAT